MLSAVLCLTLTACGEKPDKAKAEKTNAEATAKAAADRAREDEAAKVGVDAVVYGLPLVIAELTKRVQTNVAAPEPNAHAPVNQFGSMVKYPTAADKDIVRMNVDTLYSFAFLDLTAEPIILSVPDTRGRYYLSHSSTRGPTCSPRRASEPRARRRAISPSPALAGRAPSPRG